MQLSAKTSATFEASNSVLVYEGKRKYTQTQIIALIQHLKKSDMLPGICFQLSLQGCKRLAQLVTEKLQEQEAEWRKTSGWETKLDRLEVELNEAKQRYERCKETNQILSTGEIISTRGQVQRAAT